MNSKENPIPISRGKEIDAEKLLETLNQKLANLEVLHAEIVKKIKDRQVLFNREFMKADDKRNYELIAALSEEIEELEKNAGKVFDELEKVENLLAEGNEKLRDIRELSELIKEMALLEKMLKDEQ